jgi:hypothetical protein
MNWMPFIDVEVNVQGTFEVVIQAPMWVRQED